EHALGDVTAAAGFRAGIPTGPPLDGKGEREGDDGQSPERVSGPSQMKGWEEGKNRAGGFTGLARDGVNVGKLDLEKGHAADFCDGNPGEHDDHGHFQGELKEVSDKNSPEAADEGINSGERDEEQDANQQGGMRRRAESVMQEPMAAERELEHTAFCDGVAEKDGGDADHGFDDPAENEAVHQGAEIDGAKAAKKGGRFSLVAELDKFHVGEDFGAATITREEEDGHHAAEALRPPEPVAGNAVACDEAGDEERSVGGEGCGHHGRAGEPPGDIAPGDEEFFGAARGAAAVVKTDKEIEEQVGGDDDPIGGGKDHFWFYSARSTISWCERRSGVLLYSC